MGAEYSSKSIHTHHTYMVCLLLVYYYAFSNAVEFWTCFFVLGPIMAVNVVLRFLRLTVSHSVCQRSKRAHTKGHIHFFVMHVSQLAEATAPHTMDTPVLMGLGGLIIYLCVVLI